MNYKNIFNFVYKLMGILINKLKDLIIFIFNFTPKPDFLSDVAAFEGVLIAVAVPISLHVVNVAIERYKDPEIAGIFIKEPLYKVQYFLLLINIIIAIYLKFRNIQNLFCLWLIFFWFIFNIIFFYLFIKLVEQYITNIDKLLIKKFKRNVENILKK